MTLPLAIAVLALAGALAYVLRLGGEERREWARERSYLLQRIQDPEIAVREHSGRPKGKPARPVPVDDDGAYKEAKERRLNGVAD